MEIHFVAAVGCVVRGGMGHFILGVCILTINLYLNRTVKSLYEKI